MKESKPILAALDLGTNNCRLLIAAPDGARHEGFRVTAAFSRIVRLGEGFAQAGRLQDAAMERTASALAVCRERLNQHRVTHMRAVATEACRRAPNGPEFLERMAKEFDLRFDLITSAEEARLAMMGGAPLLDPSKPFALMFDIGGGSTQLSWVKVDADGQPELLDYISMPFGVVNLTEEFGSDFVPDDVFAQMVKRIHAQIRPFADKHDIADHAARGALQLIGSSGTVTTLAAVHRDMPRYQRAVIDGCSMAMNDMQSVTDRLRRLDYRGRVAIPCIGEDRADLMVAGCAILQAIRETAPVQTLRIGDRGLREGILMDLLRELGAS